MSHQKVNMAHTGSRVARFVVGPAPAPVVTTDDGTETIRVTVTDPPIGLTGPNWTGDPTTALQDGDDATLADLAIVGSYPPTSGLSTNRQLFGTVSAPNLVGRTPVEVRVHMRYTATVTVGTQANIFIDVGSFPNGLWSTPDGGVTLISDGAPHDLVITSDDPAWVSGIAEAEEAIKAYIVPWEGDSGTTTTNDKTVLIHDLSIEIDWEQTLTSTPVHLADAIPLGPNRGPFALRPGQDHLSFTARAAATQGYWVQPWAELLTESEGEYVPGNLVSLAPPVRLTPWSWAFFAKQVPLEEDATHWRLRLRVSADDPRTDPAAPPEGSIVYFDSVWVPDFGLDPSGEPYLDGDQPHGVWEGYRHRSTSIKGTKPETHVLGTALVVPEQGA